MTNSSLTALSPMIGQRPVQWQSISLAAMVHVLLIVFLWVGVQWQNKESTAVEAEVWDMTTREAAPLPVIEMQLEPEKTIPKPEKIVTKEEPLEDPEIALAQEKKRKRIEKQKQEQELKLEQEREREREKDKALKLEKEKLAEQKKKLEKVAEKSKLDEAEKQKLAELAKQKSKEQASRDKAYEENMRRLTGQAGTSGSGGSGDAAKSTGNNRGDPSYAARIAAKVRSNTVFNTSDNSSNNPTVEYRIDLLPDGSLRGAIRKLKSSGVPAFDEAVEKAIEKSLPFPRDKSGEVPASIVYVHRMKE
ncbi:cell envelope integrity protein TolA [Undibacterium parvum]|uniref:Cell envelope integrity protein TolA n=1 Tax=Undibacterium parvum TaxID=401471 RepID=A0A3Q9BRN9_9BURK|nr:cell envelope integrity protein TolA [Undibacterium parvum]AZP12976.1 cell envelope integrity protein TolA [Undibacterium parvum]